jgi:tetratricopeptide (TPR) repeat protein
MSDNIVKLDVSNWKDYTGSLAKLQRGLVLGAPLGKAITAFDRLTKHYSVVSNDRYTEIADSYQLMFDYMVKGYEDSQRAILYSQLTKRFYRLLSDMSLEAKLKFDSAAAYLSAKEESRELDINDLRDHLESFVSDMALLSLEPSGGEVSPHAKALYKERQNIISKAFVDVLMSGQWSREEAQDMAALILSPTIDRIDALVLCSSVLMAALISPDPFKLLALIKIYQEAEDEALRQRALVGWVFALDTTDIRLFKEVQDAINGLLDDEHVREEIVELQMQTIYCMNAEQDTEEIRKNFMPTLLKNQNLEITRYGIKEKEEDPMDDILHGDETDKRMEEMEERVRQMADMQKRGVDIYFGGFSKMKRFGFFYTLCNWFMPFYSHHPGLEHLSPEVLNSGFLKSLLSVGPFCDSDKYSFSLGLASIFDKLPGNIKELLDNTESAKVLGDSGIDVTTPAYLRRQYLQDLYRFFRINDSRGLFYDPFSGKEGHLFMDNDIYSPKLHTVARRLMRFLFKRRQYKSAELILDRYFDAYDNADLLFRARLMMNSQQYDLAEELFTKVLDSDAENKTALRGAALASFYNSHYSKAENLYRSLVDIYPDKIQFKLNLAISLINGDKYEDGVSTLYKLYYENPDDVDIQRALAWGLLCSKRIEQAEKFYKLILGSESCTAADRLNGGYCAWFGGDIRRAVNLFKDYLKSSDSKTGETLMRKFREDKEILDRYKVSDVDRMIMAGLA